MAITVMAERCKGCYYCIAVCPQKAVSVSGDLNKLGYEYIQVDDKFCIGCGMCFTMCPESVFEIE